MTTTTYVHNRTVRRNSFYSFKNGIGLWFINKEWITDQKMDELYPTPKINGCKTNPDKTKLWMQNTKSY